MDSPKTPEQDEILTVPDTEERAHYFWHFNHRGPSESMAAIAAAHGISARTGQRWRTERTKFDDARRVRKRKAAAKHYKLGRPWRVSSEKLELMLHDNSNPMRNAPLAVQQRVNDVPLCPRALRYNLSNRIDAHVYTAAYTDKLNDGNWRERTQYSGAHMHQPMLGFWDSVWFTDEAHFNPNKDFQKPHILRRCGERIN
ncbi:hypothetical protein CC86DRAFT_411837 [Ophiobolus disseminans]|uniref:Uncharacterized protein n=1 Tax=Ophiobolus disseminans TaxID=1469910 RepID=A0A6A6ZHT6_9PLEO|nr:hypothetical protein CC86DRAFT_411837 [Ophiobolus disseminans]